jgi:hypothetical protein
MMEELDMEMGWELRREYLGGKGGGAFVGYLIYLLQTLAFFKILCQWGFDNMR